MNFEGTALTQYVAETILMQLTVKKSNASWLTAGEWTERVRDYHKQKGGKPSAENLVTIVAKALIALDHKAHARQIVRDNSRGKWKVFHRKLQYSTEEKALNEIIRKLPDPSVFRPTKKFYNTPEWEKEFSPSFRKYKNWRCEECGLRLPPNESKDQYYLDTHHKYGLQCQDYLEHFQALCHGCHAEQDNHEEMKKGEKYKKFMKRQKKEWRKCRSKIGLPS